MSSNENSNLGQERKTTHPNNFNNMVNMSTSSSSSNSMLGGNSFSVSNKLKSHYTQSTKDSSNSKKNKKGSNLNSSVQKKKNNKNSQATNNSFLFPGIINEDMEEDLADFHDSDFPDSKNKNRERNIPSNVAANNFTNSELNNIIKHESSNLNLNFSGMDICDDSIVHNKFISSSNNPGPKNFSNSILGSNNQQLGGGLMSANSSQKINVDNFTVFKDRVTLQHINTSNPRYHLIVTSERFPNAQHFMVLDPNVKPHKIQSIGTTYEVVIKIIGDDDSSVNKTFLCLKV